MTPTQMPRPRSSTKCPLLKTLLLAIALFAGLCCAPAQVNVLTYHNDFARTGQNTNETALTPANVNSNTFGLLFTYPVDGQVYAEPLYISNLSIPGQGTHNVVFIATQHDSVYAFDADSITGATGGLLWHTNLGVSAATPNNDFGNRYGAYHDIDPEVGITSTPVINLASGTLYLDAFTHDGPGLYHHRIHALNITNGQERPFSPVIVTASVPGVGVDSSNGVVNFTAIQQLQRPALTLAAGKLYVCYSGFADTDPYHGWVIGFNAATLQQLTNYVFNTTPNATTAAFGSTAAEGGIWMSGNGLAVDASGNLFFEVGNGSFTLTNVAGTEYGDSFIKLSATSGLAVADFFTPYNQAALSAGDTDVGSGGLLLLPDSVGSVSHPHLLVGCGKEGKIYLLDRDNLGHFNSFADTNIVQELPGAVGGTWSSGAYFNGHIYYQGSGDVLKAFQISSGLLGTSPSSQSATAFGWPGATPAISANGINNAIAWVIQADGYPGNPAILHAYDANNLALELYNSSQAGGRDTMANTVKFAVPTVANGKVYAGAEKSVAVFGLGAFLAVPVISPAGGVFTNSVMVTLSEATPGASLYYTLDGSVPSTNSTLYSGPFLLNDTALISVQAFKATYSPSRVATAVFLNSASLSLAPGFLKQEFYSGATRANLEDPTFTNPPTFINYLSSFETPSGQGINYAERVSGYFIAPVTTNYVFFVCSDDDSDLFLSTDSSPANKQLIASETVWSNTRQWLSSSGGSVVASKRSDQFTGTTWPGGNTISLTAGTVYYIEGDHHQGGGGDDFAATFKFAGVPDPANGTPPALLGNSISTYAYNNTFITLNAQPANVVAVQGTVAAFTVNAASGYLGGSATGPAPSILYQWQSAPAGSGAFTNTPGPAGNTYTTPLLKLSDNGAQFRAVLTTAGAAATSAVATVTVVPNATPPVPVRVLSVNQAGTAVTLDFSQPLDAASAQTSANYHLTPGNLMPTSALLDASGTNLTLTTGSPLLQNTTITLSISNVRSVSGTAVLPGTTISFSFFAATSGGYATTVLADNPLGYWRLNEAVGPIAVDAVGAHNGTYASAATPNVTGPRPPAFSGFENTNTAVQTFVSTLNSYVAVPFGSLSTNTVTFTAWLYPLGAQESWSGLLVTRGNGVSGGMNYNSQQMLGYTWNNNSGLTYNFVSGLVIPTNQWSLVAMVIYPDKAILYLGSTGTLRSATNVLAHTSDVFGNNWQIGHDNSGGNATRTFNGLLDEVAVFTQSLSPARISAYYQAALQGGVLLTNLSVTPNALQFTEINAVSGQVVLQWLGTGTLQESTNLLGPWTLSPFQNNPAIAPMSGIRFYRLHQ
ncbi:MAG TPA: LamG-like jellyroll fold domain-containing protein [Candidatus Acidoferrum sp.]|jgi:hypothetical protein|nr:LamG-like jellyroll fold domain-containing protein [Candidatus Acidoferrum sp.]